jgi:hypothetical protein
MGVSDFNEVLVKVKNIKFKPGCLIQPIIQIHQLAYFSQ